MGTTLLSYSAGDTICHGALAEPQHLQKKAPAVLVFHDWTGCNVFAKNKAKMLADMGYIALAVDMYGQGKQGETLEEKTALIQPFLENRSLIIERANAAYAALKAHPMVDASRVAAIGFCFGGMCVLDLARSGSDIAGVVSFHGLLPAIEGYRAASISAKVLVLHGYDDPMVQPEQVQQFCKEMSAASADWQVHMYGATQHAFTNPEANDATIGTIYKPVAEQRALQAMHNFLKALF